MRRVSAVSVAILGISTGVLAQPSPAPRSLRDLDRSLAGLDDREHEIESKLRKLKEERRRLDARIVLRGRRYVRASRAGLLPVGGGFDRLVDHATRLERLRRGLKRDLDRGAAVTRDRAALQKKLDEIAQIRGPLQTERRALDRARAALLAQEDRALAFQRAFESSTGSAHTAIYGSPFGPTGPSGSVAGFSAMKGRVPFPIAGRAEIRSAHRGSHGPGLEMIAPRGTPVRAVYPGRIGFADEYSELGKTVIVDHGGGDFTVSANLSEISVTVGDEVDTGARIGAVGDDGSGPKLYFEIRIGGETVDPAEWFGI